MRTLIVLLFSASSLLAQTFIVQFYGTNSIGIPAYWPKQVQPGTNAPPGFVILTKLDLDQIISTNQPAYRAWESNKTAQAEQKSADDFADLMAKLDKVESYIEKSSGTNSLSANQMNNAINDICRAFKKLRPVLKDNYKPE